VGVEQLGLVGATIQSLPGLTAKPHNTCFFSTRREAGTNPASSLLFSFLTSQLAPLYKIVVFYGYT
jgi:hypothetical protein